MGRGRVYLDWRNIGCVAFTRWRVRGLPSFDPWTLKTLATAGQDPEGFIENGGWSFLDADKDDEDDEEEEGEDDEEFVISGSDEDDVRACPENPAHPEKTLPAQPCWPSPSNHSLSLPDNEKFAPFGTTEA